MDEPENYPAGTIRYKDGEGKYIITSPHDPLYSTATMAVEEYWKDGKWWPLFGEEPCSK